MFTTGKGVILADPYSNDPRFNRTFEPQTGLQTREMYQCCTRCAANLIGAAQLLNKVDEQLQ